MNIILIPPADKELEEAIDFWFDPWLFHTGKGQFTLRLTKNML